MATPWGQRRCVRNWSCSLCFGPKTWRRSRPATLGCDAGCTFSPLDVARCRRRTCVVCTYCNEPEGSQRRSGSSDSLSEAGARLPPRKRTYRGSGRAGRVALRAASFRNNLTGRGAAQLWAEFRAVRESGGVEWKRLQRLGREAAGRRSTRHVSSFGTLRRRIDGRRVAATQLLHARWNRMAAKSKASVVSHVAAGAASLSADRGMRRAGAAPYQRPLPSNVSILCGCVKRRHSTELRCNSGKRARGRSWISSRTPWGAAAAAQPENGAHLKGRPSFRPKRRPGRRGQWKRMIQS